MRTTQLVAWTILLLAASAHSHELPLSQLSGTWTGVRYMRATGQCRTDPRRDVELTLDVRDGGRIQVTDGDGYVGTGDVSPDDWMGPRDDPSPAVH